MGPNYLTKETTLFTYFQLVIQHRQANFFVTDGYKSLRSPGSAKNILTIGAAQSVRVDEQVIGEDNKEIYMTDETDESTHLTKILKWSLQDYDKNIGMKTLFEQGRLKVQISRNPTEFTNTTVFGHR